jgi:hypothetical protein
MPIAELRHKYFLSNPSPPPKLSFAKKPKMSAVSHNGPVMIQNHLKKNNSALKLVVQKYGGTSIGKFPVQIADIVRYTEVTASLRPILLLNTTQGKSHKQQSSCCMLSEEYWEEERRNNKSVSRN